MSEGTEALRSHGGAASGWLPLLPRMMLVLVSAEGEVAFLRFCEQNGLATRAIGRCRRLRLVSPHGFDPTGIRAVLHESIGNVCTRLRLLHEGQVQPGEMGPAEVEAMWLGILREIEGELLRLA